MQTIETYQEDGSALSRLEVWGFALKLTKDRPIVGGGFRVSYNDAIYLKYVPDARTGRGRNYHSVYRSEEHTSELQSLMRLSYAVFCLQNKNQHPPHKLNNS